MADYKIPGPAGSDTNQVKVDQGTNAVTETPRQGVVGMEWRAAPTSDSTFDKVLNGFSALGSWTLELKDAVDLGMWWLIGSPTGDWEFGPEDRQTVAMQNTRAFKEAIEAYQAWHAQGRPFGNFHYGDIPCEWVQSKDAFYVKGRTSGYTTGSTWQETVANPLWAFTGTFSILIREADGFAPGTVYVELDNYASLPSFFHGWDSANAFIDKWGYTKTHGIPMFSRSGQHYRFMMRVSLVPSTQSTP